MLSYSGEIVNEFKENYLYKSHRLFRNWDYLKIKENMKNENILIRSASNPSYCVIIVRILEDVFFSFKLLEKLNFYKYESIKYDSIDKFINEYIKNVFISIYKIMKFKYFFKDEDDLKKHLMSAGDYLKYGVFFPKDYNGFLELRIGTRSSPVKIDGDKLKFNNMKFEDLESLVKYVKTSR